jgi:hydroxyacylglutathione hydrolase
MTIQIINIDTPTLGDRGYIAHDGKTALVVDPQRDIDRVDQILAENSLSLGAGPVTLTIGKRPGA